MEPSRVAVVTGAGGLIGRALSLELARRGAAVLAVDVSGDAAGAVADEVRAAGGVAEPHAADVADEPSVEGYVAAAADRWGRIDWFAANAGVEGPAGPITGFPTDGFRRVLEINVVGVFLGLKHVLPVMQRQGSGAVVTTSSVAGHFATPQTVAYGASKHAVIGLTRTAAVEHAKDGIRVNAICPGPIEGRMMRSIEANVAPDDPEALHAAYLSVIPMGRYGEAEEIARTMAWLLDDAPAYLTGQAIVVDGGFLVS